MERRLNQSTIYQGLFVVALALFAHERLQLKTVVATTQPAELSDDTMLRSKPLYRVYTKLRVDPLFSTQIDGVELEYQNNRVTIVVENEEIYRNQEALIEKTWTPFFEKVTSALEDLLKSGEFEIKIVGFPDLRNALDQEANALNKGPLNLSINRADSLARSMKRTFARYKNIKFELAAGTSASHGHRIEIQIQSLN